MVSERVVLNRIYVVIGCSLDDRHDDKMYKKMDARRMTECLRNTKGRDIREL